MMEELKMVTAVMHHEILNPCTFAEMEDLINPMTENYVLVV